MAFGQQSLELKVDFRNDSFMAVMKHSEPAAARATSRGFRAFMVRLRKETSRNMLLKRRTGRFMKGINVKSSKKNVKLNYVFSQITYNWYAGVHEFGGAVQRKATTVKAHKRMSGGFLKKRVSVKTKVRSEKTNRFKRKSMRQFFDIPQHKRKASIAMYKPKLRFRDTYENVRNSGFLEETIAKNMNNEFATIILKAARSGGSAVDVVVAL